MYSVKHNQKKLFILFFFLAFFCTSLFAIPPITVDTTSEIWNNNWDLPIVEALIYFGGALVTFMDLARKLCIFFFFLNLVWHSFKLWFGAVEIKKVVIDIVYKYLLIMVLMTVYPSLVDRVFSLATNIGIGCTNSATYLTNNITATFTASYNATLSSVKIIKEALVSGNMKNIKPEDLKKLAKAMALDEKELENEFKQAYPDLKVSNVFDDISDFEEAKKRRKEKGEMFVTIKALVDATKKTDTRRRTYEKMFTESIKDYDLENLVILFDTFNSSFGMGDINEGVVAKIMNGEASEEDMNAAIALGESQIKENIRSYFTSPYMVVPYQSTEHTVGTEANSLKSGFKNVSKSFQTAILSPSQILRIGIMLAKVVENKSKLSVDKHQNNKGEQENVIASPKPLNFTKITISDIFSTIIKFIFPFLMIIPIVICIVQYIVTVLEYYLITSIGIIFVPLIFFDPLKQYGSKLLQLFFSYFMKVMTISIVTYFCLGFLLKSGTYLMLEIDTFSFQSVGYGIFIFVLSLVLTQSAPELGQILISGNPSLNAGTVARAGHQMAHAYRMGSNAARRVAHTGATVAKGAAGAAVGGVLAGKTLAQNRAAVFEQGKSIHDAAIANGKSEPEAKQMQKEFQRDTNRQMLKEDIGQHVKSKFGYTSNSSREKDDMARSVGGIGQKNAEGTKISSSMNKDYAAERAKKAHQAYLGKNDIVDKKLENNNGGTST